MATIFAAQALRAFAYGLGSVLLASSLLERGLDTTVIGLILACMVAGTALAQLVVGRWADRIGRRRSYLTLHLLLVVAATAYAADTPTGALVVAALLGVLSVEVVETGPFTTLELSMLAGKLNSNLLASGFGWYNAIASAAGSLGALAAGLPAVLRRSWESPPPDRVWLLVPALVGLAGAGLATRLSGRVEAVPTSGRTGLGKSSGAVRRLASLFAVDAFAGGFVVQGFLVVWLIERHQAGIVALGALFAAIGVVQTLSFLVAPLLARRFGLLRTMVFTHLPSNMLLVAVGFAPTFASAAALLLARAAVSQMDVPTRQAFVLAVVTPGERTAATAYTSTARYLARPVGPIVAGASVASMAAVPFVVAGVLKSIYDLTLLAWFRHTEETS